MTVDDPADALLAILDRVVARASGGEGVEVYGIDETQLSIKAYDAEVEALSSARTRGVGIRVLSEGRFGYAWTSDLTERALAETLDDARRNATATGADDANVLPEPLPPSDVGSLDDQRFGEVTTQDKVALALQLEAGVRRAGGAVKGVDSATYGDGRSAVAIASTTGIRAATTRCDAYVVVEALAEADGATTSAYGLDTARVAQDLDVEAAAEEAVRRALLVLGGRKPGTARVPVVFDPFATAEVIGVLSGALTAEAVQKGRSLFAGKVGQVIGAERLTLVDDGTLPGGLSTMPWDDEGVPTSRTLLLESGVLRGYLHNTHTAARDGTASTGNASRSGFRSPPGVAPSNLHLLPGDRSPEALLRDVGDGFYCQRLMGLHSGANPVTGEFSVGVNGVMVRDGALAEPVREATIAGTLPAMLMGVAAVGSDLRWLPFGGGLGGLTLIVEGMTLAGA